MSMTCMWLPAQSSEIARIACPPSHAGNHGRPQPPRLSHPQQLRRPQPQSNGVKKFLAASSLPTPPVNAAQASHTPQLLASQHHPHPLQPSHSALRTFPGHRQHLAPLCRKRLLQIARRAIEVPASGESKAPLPRKRPCTSTGPASNLSGARRQARFPHCTNCLYAGFTSLQLEIPNSFESSNLKSVHLVDSLAQESLRKNLL